MSNALKMTMYGSLTSGTVPPITDAELNAYLNSLTCSGTRKELMRAALSLVGRVPYFWGGKSAPGWNEAWNTPRLVTSAGSSSTGTIRPYGLDCSGFTDWVYRLWVSVCWTVPGVNGIPHMQLRKRNCCLAILALWRRLEQCLSTMYCSTLAGAPMASKCGSIAPVEQEEWHSIRRPM